MVAKQRLLILACLFCLVAACGSKGKRRETVKKLAAVQKKTLRSGSTQRSNPLFKDKTKHYGLGLTNGVQFYAIDLNFDQYVDLVIMPSAFSVPHFYLFNPKKQKFERSKLSFFKELNRVSFMYFADLDSDGLLDAVTGRFRQKTDLGLSAIEIHRGTKLGDRYFFVKVESKELAQSWPTAGVSLLDYDLDGDLDMFLPNWFHFDQGETTFVPDKLFNFNKWHYRDVTKLLSGELKYDKASKRYTHATPSIGSSTCDVDQNGFPDILTVSSNGYANRMWLNLSTGKVKDRIFKDYASESGYASDIFGKLLPTGGGNTFFSACTDYNNDQLIDIFVGEVFHSRDPETVDKSSILSGSQFKFPPKFVRTDYIHSVQESWNQGDKRGVWADLNFDGMIDLLVDNSGFPPDSRLVYFEQAPDNAFEDKSQQASIDILNPSGTIVLDVNRDGKLDILTGQITTRAKGLLPRVYLFENNIPYAGRRSLRLYLAGKRSNKAGLGATVILQTNRNIRKQIVEYAQGGRPSQHQEGLLFGLARGEQLQKIEVRWPYLPKGQKKPLVRSYRVNALKFKRYLALTLCETGEFRPGKVKCP